MSKQVQFLAHSRFLGNEGLLCSPVLSEGLYDDLQNLEKRE